MLKIKALLSFLFILIILNFFYCSSIPDTSYYTKSIYKSDYLKGAVQKDSLSSSKKIRLQIKQVNSNYFPDSVIVSAILSDEDGNIIKGLAPPFSKEDNSKEIFNNLKENIVSGIQNCNNKVKNIIDYNVTEIHEVNSDPVAIAVSLDYSGSMVGNVYDLDNAVENMISMWSKSQKDNISIVKWDHRVKTIVPPTKNIVTVRTDMQYSNNNFYGYTALYLGALEAMKNISKLPEKKILLLFTDGYDNSSGNIKAADVIDFARKNYITIFTIGLADNPYAVDESVLKKLAEGTGGKYYFAQRNFSQRNINDIFTEIFMLTKVYYKIIYKPDPECPDQERKIFLTAKDPVTKNTILTDSTNYFPPKAIVAIPEVVRKPEIVIFIANPEKVKKGESSDIEWKVLNAEDYKISIDDIGDSLENRGKAKVSPEITTVYTLKVWRDGNVIAKKSLEIIAPREKEIVKEYDFGKYDIPFFITGYYRPNTPGSLDELFELYKTTLKGASFIEKFEKNSKRYKQYKEWGLSVDNLFRTIYVQCVEELFPVFKNLKQDKKYFEISITGFADPRNFAGKYLEDEKVTFKDVNGEEFTINKGDKIDNFLLSGLRAYYTGKFLDVLFSSSSKKGKTDYEELIKSGKIKFSYIGANVINDKNDDAFNRRISITFSKVTVRLKELTE